MKPAEQVEVVVEPIELFEVLAPLLYERGALEEGGHNYSMAFGVIDGRLHVVVTFNGTLVEDRPKLDVLVKARAT